MTTISKSLCGSATSYHATSLQDESKSSNGEKQVETFSILDNDDCLCFARQNHHHHGNVQFQHLVEQYASSDSFDNVQETVQHVIEEFQSRHGRFVEKLSNGAFAALLPSSHSRLQDYVMNALQQASNKNKRRSTRAKIPTKRLVDEHSDKPRVRASRRATTNDDYESHHDSSPQDQADKGQDKENSNLIHVLKDADVISTNGGSHMLPHPGNIRFVNMSVAYGQRYHKARSDQGRFAVVQDFIQAFQQEDQGRFVKHLGNGVYQELPQGSVIQKATRALRRATATARNKGDHKAGSLPMSKRTRRKRTVTGVGNDTEEPSHEILPASKDAHRVSETRFGRKRRRISRFQDEHQAAVTPTTTRLVKTTAEIMVGPTPAKRTSSSRVQDVPPKTTASKRTSPRLEPNRVSPDTVPTMTPSVRNKPLVLSSRGIPIVPSTPNTSEMPVVLANNGTPHGLGLLAQRFTKWVMVRTSIA